MVVSVATMVIASGSCQCDRPAERVFGDEHASCPSPEVIEDVHAIFYLIEQRAQIALVQERMGRARARLEAEESSAFWDDFMQRTERSVMLYATDHPEARLEEEMLRAELQYSPCLDEATHTKMHERLERDPAMLSHP